jgi:hypothetical protein
MNGFLAWERLCERFKPNTPAKALVLMMEVMNPTHQTDPDRSPQAINEWDRKAQSLDKEFGEKLSDRMKTAVALSMIPGDLTDTIHQQGANLKDYSDAKARFMGLAQNRIPRSQRRKGRGQRKRSVPRLRRKRTLYPRMPEGQEQRKRHQWHLLSVRGAHGEGVHLAGEMRQVQKRRVVEQWLDRKWPVGRGR